MREIKDEDLKRMWLVDRISLRKIAALVPMTAQGIKKRLNKMGIDTSKASFHYDLTCIKCGSIFNRVRMYKNAKYCSNKCRIEETRNPNYKQSKQGTRIARKVVSEYFKLKPGNIVHHVDQDQTNNDINNLWVFATSSDHHKWHWNEGKDGTKPIWKITPAKE